jgi:hypothetical protein
VLEISSLSKKVLKIPIKLMSVLTEKGEKATEETRDWSSTKFELPNYLGCLHATDTSTRFGKK